MPIIISVVARIVYLCAVLFVAFWIGIAVAMGFDAGVSLGASLFAFLYLFTFIPASLLSVIPLSKLVKPPLVLKVWYWWVALLSGVYAIFWAFGVSKIMLGASNEIVDRIIHRNNYATICQQVLDTDPNAQVWIGIGNSQRSTRYGVWTGRYCSTVPLSNAPFQVRLGDIQNPRIALEIALAGGSTTCVALTPGYKGASPQSADWTAKVIDCGR